jgi:single-strand selective monofunctional uracil DNA glycosylase
MGMNPGPWGMAQTGVPFGEIAAVRDWMGIRGTVGQPPAVHPKRPVEGFACARSEVSGRRLWGLMMERFGDPDSFFAEHFVANYCPLVFMAESGRNVTPDKLPAGEREPLFALCDSFLRITVDALDPAFVVGVGKFAETRIRIALGDSARATVCTILHPSPASPAANRGWAEAATSQLIHLGIWTD